MAFDGGRRDPFAPVAKEPLDWLDIITRTVGVSLFAGVYLFWLHHALTSALTAAFGE